MLRLYRETMQIPSALSSVGADGSNDAGIEKMNPICVKIFDVNRLKTVKTHFVDMCLTSGTDGSTAEGIKFPGKTV